MKNYKYIIINFFISAGFYPPGIVLPIRHDFFRIFIFLELLVDRRFKILNIYRLVLDNTAHMFTTQWVTQDLLEETVWR